MKFFTPVKTKVTLVLIVMMTFTMTVFAQSEKYSPSTQMFITLRDANAFGEGVVPSESSEPSITNNKSTFSKSHLNKKDLLPIVKKKKLAHPIAQPKMINGVLMIQASIELTDNNYSEFEALGMRIDCKDNNYINGMIPVDKIEAVAALKNVKILNVAEMYTLDSNKGREKTKAIDALSFSTNAQEANLLQAYRGKDVVVGVIDGGIQFNHAFFKDANGKTRIKKAYKYNSDNSTLEEFTSESDIEALTYDYTGDDHGTHTSSLAAGSDLTLNVVDYIGEKWYKRDFTYGGIAPEADLVLCGLGDELTSTNVETCIKGIKAYAESVGKPCVISMSFGSHKGPHDGSGVFKSINSQNSGPGSILVRAAGNEADGKMYLYMDNVSKDSPLNSILDMEAIGDIETSDAIYSNMIVYGYASAYARSANVPIGVTVYVIDQTTNKIVWYKAFTSVHFISEYTEGDFGGRFGQYFEPYYDDTRYCLYIYNLQDTYSNKYYAEVEPYFMWNNDYTTTTSNGKTTYTGKYKLAVSFYPTKKNARTTIDCWGESDTYFDDGSATYEVSNKTITQSFIDGSNFCSVTQEAMDENVISVGAYTARNMWAYKFNSSTNQLNAIDFSSVFPENEIADFSSFAVEGYGPLGKNYPDVVAPGVWAIAGYNKGRFSDEDYDANSDAVYYLNGYGEGSDSPLGVMSGTSMSTPVTAGTIALFLQADPTLTPAKIRKIIKETAFHDKYTDANFSRTVNDVTYISTRKDPRFGNGKIDALAGLQYITTYRLNENQLEITDMLPYDEDTGLGLMSYDHKRYVEYPRSMAAGWASVCLPFNTTVEELGAYGVEKAVEYKGTKQIGDYRFMAKFESTTTLNANTPYLVKLTDAKTKVEFKRGVNETWSPGDEGTYVAVSPEADNFIEVRDEVNDAYTMTGTEIYYDGSNNDSPIVKGDYIFSSTTINAVKGGNKLRAFRAYLKATPGIADAAQIAGYTFDGEDLTGIEAVQVDELFGGPAYNLRGQRVTTPQKGIIIQNGKKRVVK